MAAKKKAKKSELEKLTEEVRGLRIAVEKLQTWPWTYYPVYPEPIDNSPKITWSIFGNGDSDSQSNANAPVCIF